MKRIITLSMAVALGALTVTSCSKDRFNCKKANGKMTTETRMVETFSQVHLKGSGDMTFHQISAENDQKIVVEASNNIMDRIDTEVNNGKLTIDNDCVRGNKSDMKFDIYVYDLSSVKISGSGSAVSNGMFDVSNNLELEISGSGDVDFETEANDLMCDISGSGDIKLKGVSETLDIEIDGSGDVHAFPLTTNDCFIDISGSGNCEVTTNGVLDIRISGSGDVTYDGTPTAVNTDTQGSGDVMRR